jgi:hypothetical protein
VLFSVFCKMRLISFFAPCNVRSKAVACLAYPLNPVVVGHLMSIELKVRKIVTIVNLLKPSGFFTYHHV